MGSSASTEVTAPERKPVPEGKTRINLMAFTMTTHGGRGRQIVDAIVKAYPDKYESWYFFLNGETYRTFLNQTVKKTWLNLPEDSPFAGHRTSPFVWFEKSDGSKTPIGGRDRLCDWVNGQEEFKGNPEILELCKDGPSLFDAWVDTSKGTAN